VLILIGTAGSIAGAPPPVPLSPLDELALDVDRTAEDVGSTAL
jgi:hypothetical protein